MTITLTVAEVLDALHCAQARTGSELGEDIPPNTFSGPEIRDALRLGARMFQRQMMAWIAEGTCRVVPIRKYAVDGRLLNTRAYQFVKGATRKS